MHHKIQQEIKSQVLQKENQVYHVCFIQRVLAIVVQIVLLHMWVRKHQPRRRQNSRPRLLPQQKQPLPLLWPAVQARFLELKPAIPASTSFASNFTSTLRYAFAPFRFLLSVFAAVSSSITSTGVCISASSQRVFPKELPVPKVPSGLKQAMFMSQVILLFMPMVVR